MSRQTIADFSLVGIAAAWGISFVLTKNVLELIPSFTFIFLRFAIAFIVLGIVFHRKFKSITLKTLKRGLLIGSMLFTGIVFQIAGLKYTTASNCAFITGLSVVFVPVISSVMLKKKAEGSVKIGVLLSSAGLFFLTGGYNSLNSSGLNIGDLLCLFGALGFSMHIIFIDKFTSDEDSITLSIIQIGLVSLLSAILCAAVPGKPVAFQTDICAVLVITGVLGTAVAYTVQNMAQSKTSPTHTAMIITAEPVFGVIFAVLIPNSRGIAESLQANTIIGCVCILAAMLVSEIKPVRVFSGKAQKKRKQFKSSVRI